MPLPRRLAELNRAGLNRVVRHVAPWAPGFGVVVHQGRRSGRTYETPVNVFADGDDLVIALTYGTDADWVRNVLAAEDFTLRTRGHTVPVTAVRVFRDEARRAVPRPVAAVLGALEVSDFLEVRRR